MPQATPDRVKAVRQLLVSMADWEPTPRAATARGALPGEIGATVAPCPHCDHGKLKGGGSCRHCHGTGRVHTDPQTGREAAPVTEGFAIDLRDLERSIRWRRVRCDRCGGGGCDRCARTGSVDVIDTRLEAASLARTRREWGDDPTPPDWWLSAALKRKDALFATGSYRELERVLDELRAVSPAAWRILDRHLVHPEPITLTRRRSAQLHAAVVWVTERMPYAIRVPDHARAQTAASKRSVWFGHFPEHDRARLERNQQAALLRARDVPVAEIAVELGVSERHVRRVAPIATVAA